MSRKTVLFVDDEELILKTIQRIVRDRDFDALFASSGAEALTMLEKQPVHVIVTDMRMPQMSGLDLLGAVKEKYPHIVRVVLSGYTDVSTLLTAINEGRIFRYVTKPWESQNDLLAVVLEALERADEELPLAAAPIGTAEEAGESPL